MSPSRRESWDGARKLVVPGAVEQGGRAQTSQHANVQREKQLRIGEDDENEDAADVRITTLTAGAGNSPEAQAEREELLRRVEEAMARMPENRRLAVGLHLNGLTTDEIADLMGWSEPKAHNLAYRGLKDLRKEFRDAGIEYNG